MLPVANNFPTAYYTSPDCFIFQKKLQKIEEKQRKKETEDKTKRFCRAIPLKQRTLNKGEKNLSE